jgi:hypothetical protein
MTESEPRSTDLPNLEAYPQWLQDYLLDWARKHPRKKRIENVEVSKEWKDRL